jgi:Cof subfamily protein (haloacid dehalogenase superfamily)
MIRLLAIDIDGTLLDSRGRLPDAHRDAIVEAQARGIEIALVTGRSFHFTKPVAALLPAPLTLIVSNGALVKDPGGATHLRRLLDRGVARAILAATAAYEDSVAIVFDRPDERQIVFDRMDWEHPNRRGYYEKNRAFIAPAAGPLADALTEDPLQVMFNGPVEPMRSLVASLRGLAAAGRFSVAITEYVRRDFALVDVNGGDCSKGATLARWAGRRQIRRDQVMAVGDNLNDVDMLTFAGTAFLMGNAAPETRERLPGARLTAGNDENGLALAIRSVIRV